MTSRFHYLAVWSIVLLCCSYGNTFAGERWYRSGKVRHKVYGLGYAPLIGSGRNAVSTKPTRRTTKRNFARVTYPRRPAPVARVSRQPARLSKRVGRTSGWVNAGRDRRSGYYQVWVDHRIYHTVVGRKRLITAWRSPDANGVQTYIYRDVRQWTQRASRTINGQVHYAVWVDSTRRVGRPSNTVRRTSRSTGRQQYRRPTKTNTRRPAKKQVRVIPF